MEIFAKNVIHIIPYGDFYKKVRATKYIEENVKSSTMRRKMLKLLTLIPKKKSLYLAQIEMKDRTVEDILHEFQEQNLSPVVISKRQCFDYLENLYVHL